MPPSQITQSGPMTAEDRARNIRTLRAVLPSLWPKGENWAKQRVVLAMLLLIAAKAISVMTPFVYKAAVDALAGQGRGDGWAIGVGAVGLTVAYGLARLASVAFGELRDAVFVRVAQRALRKLALRTFRHMHALSMRYHITRRTGGLSRIIERGVKGVEFLLRFMLFSVGPLILELSLVTIIFAWVFDWRYALAVVVTIWLYVWFTFKVTEWRVAIRRRMNEADTAANQKAIDSLLNFETVKYFGAEAREARRYDDSMRVYESAAVRTGQSLAFLNFGQGLIITAGLVVVTVYREIRQPLVDMGEMFDLLDQPAEIRDRAEAKPLKVTGGEVVLDHVGFGYTAERPILRDVSLTIPAGHTLALVGSSGSGKSTIGRLLFRFYDVTAGAIRIDGQDLRDVTQDSLHDAIGVVPQDTVLFNDTIRYNIAYGRDGATEDEVIAAAKAAKIHDFVMSLPEGYETTVGERGLKLSGGEKQRVGIARTLLKNPPILLLDEATSALDTQTERDIQDSLRAMGEGRTVITIAHRLSTIADADCIVVLQKGQIAEQGRHDELLARGGRYAAMWAAQQAEDLD